MIESSLMVFGIAIMFGLAFIMTIISFQDLESFFLWMTIFCGFVVWTGFLPLWTLVACFILDGLIFIQKINNRGTT